MSAVYLKLMTLLCLSCTALSDESSGVVWRDFGGAVTIQCRPPKKGQDSQSLSLIQGLSENVVLFKGAKSEKTLTDKVFSGRLQLNGAFPNVDILIKNLTSNDSGPYWCRYTKFDVETSERVEVKGLGSVLLVVTDTTLRCDPSNNNHLILVSVVICAAALLVIIICFLIWIILKTKMCTTKKPRRVAGNDVYEDMRGTIKR